MIELIQALTFRDWTILQRNKAFWGLWIVMDILMTLAVGIIAAYDGGNMNGCILLAPFMGYEAAATLLFALGGKVTAVDFDVEEVDDIVRQSGHSMFAYMIARSMLYMIISVVSVLLPLVAILIMRLAPFSAIIAWQIPFSLILAAAIALSGALLMTGFAGRSGMHVSLLCLSNQMPAILFAACSLLLPQPWPLAILLVFMVSTVYIAVQIDRKHHVVTLQTMTTPC